MELRLKKKNDLFDAKSLHELLYDHQSEDFKKSRRNLMVITFIIISAGVLGVDLTKLNILGLKLREIPNPSSIYLVGIVLIGYWLIMFEVYRKRDKNIHSLHNDIVIKTIRDLEDEIPILEEEYNNFVYPPSTHLPTSTHLSSSEERRIDVESGAEYKSGLYQQIQDRKYAAILFKNSMVKNQPTLKWVLKVEEFEIKFPRALAYLSMSICVLSYWLFF